jgi:hypothetical protein
MTKKQNIWISPRGSDWAVKKGGAEKALKVTDTKQDAIEKGKDLAKKEGVDLIIQGRDGKIQSKDSYGHDPNPPKDKEH